MNEIWQTVITALGGYTVVFGGLFWWIGNRRLQSLLAREKGEIQKEVNRDNAELLAKHQKCQHQSSLSGFHQFKMSGF